MEFKIISSEELDEITNSIKQLHNDLRDVVKRATNPLQEIWLDNQDACRVLKVSPRTLQNYRDNGTLFFSNIGGKIFYKAADIEAVLLRNYSARKGGCSHG